MARITTEDCEHLVDGRFELVAVTAERTKQLLSGAPAVVEGKNDKATVTSLRELKFLNIDDLRAALIARQQRYAREDHSNEIETTLADDLMEKNESIGFLPDSEGFSMFSEEGFDDHSGNVFSDDAIDEDEDR